MNLTRRRITTTMLGLLAAATLTTTTACSEEMWSTDNGMDVPTFTESPREEVSDTDSAAPGTVDQTNDYYRITGPAQRDYQTTPGNVGYCEPDDLGRAVCAYGELTHTTDRTDISGDPVGWPDSGINQEVSIPALAGVNNSEDYHGWFWNRSHLLAASLGGNGDANTNAVPGTRTQNVGSATTDGQWSGGMAHTELMARNYLHDRGHDGAVACPLYYAATPVYIGDELIPRTVIVDIASCDNEINERVEVDNTANNWTIDYHTGAYTAQVS